MKTKTYISFKISILSITVICLIGMLIFLLTEGPHYHWKWNFKKEQKIIYEDTYSISELEQIYINVKSTDITVKPSKDNEIHITIYGEKEEEVSSTLTDNQLTITKNTKNEFCFGFCFVNNNEIVLDLPVDMSTTLYFKTSSGDIQIADFPNINVNAETSSGDIAFGTVKNINGKTQSGDVEGKNVEHVSFHTSSGDIRFNNIKGKVDLKTSSGDIDIKNFQILENSNIDTTSGDVSISHITDTYIATKTRSGDTTIKESNRFSEFELQIETNSGDIIVK